MVFQSEYQKERRLTKIRRNKWNAGWARGAAVAYKTGNCFFLKIY